MFVGGISITVKEFIELIATFIMLFGLYLIYRTRTQGEGKGIGLRVIQLAGVVLIVPSIFILALEGLLSTEIVATLFGTIIGYILSGIDEKKDAVRLEGLDVLKKQGYSFSIVKNDDIKQN